METGKEKKNKGKGCIPVLFRFFNFSDITQLSLNLFILFIPRLFAERGLKST